MSEQTSQTSAFVPPAYLGDMRVYDIGSTTLADCYRTGIIRKDPPKEHRNKKPDLLIVSNDGRIVLYLESKGAGKLSARGGVARAYEQEFKAAKSVGSAIFALRDDDSTYWYNPATGNRILDEDGNPLQFHLQPREHPTESARMLLRIMSSIDSHNDRLLAREQQNPTDLARKVHQMLYTWKSVSPATALYTFVEIFLFKYLSDLGILQGVNSFSHLIDLYADEANTNLDVLRQYMNGPREKIKAIFPPNQQTESVKATTIINDTVFHDDVGDAETFHGILKLFVDYEDEHGKFRNISPDFKSQLFETFLKQDGGDKRRLGQFFTPLKIVRNMTRSIEIREGMSICDPACGVGKFPLEAIAPHIDDFFHYDDRTGGVTSTVTMSGFDKETEDNRDLTIILAKANALIYFSRFLSDNPTERCAKSLAENVLNASFKLKVDSLGTLDELYESRYDVILANPPYLVNGSKDMRDKANQHSTVYKKGADGEWVARESTERRYTWGGLGLEALFIEWIVRSLKPGGEASVVIPDGILRNSGDASLRSHIAEECEVDGIISLPVNAFFSTQKKTYILNMRRKRRSADGSLPKQERPVFMYVCSSIGETLDVYRFDDPDNDDLTHAIDSYNVCRRMFDAHIDESVIRSYVDSLEPSVRARLRLVPASTLHDGSWVVEDHWSEDEKVALGLRNERETLTPARFSELLQETIQVMDEYSKELECME